MSLEELEAKRAILKAKTDITLKNMQIIADESMRVASVAHNSRDILNNLDKTFEEKTGLKGMDVAFLFLATGLQCLRIYVLNDITKREKASKMKNEDGSYTREGKIYKKEREIMDRFKDGFNEKASLYYAPLNQIILNPKVPYDSTRISKTGSGFFQHANHRFATLGHDPILGLFFGTANILTNTITTTRAPIPGIYTNHVSYDMDIMKNGDIKFKSPEIQIGEDFPASTIVMCTKVKERFEHDKKSFVAALIKQILHIGSDMYTKAGIQFPGANLILSPKQTELLTKYVDWGTTVKTGVAGLMAEVINGIISVLHNLMYSDDLGISREVYNVKTRKIIMYSNILASGSNIIKTGLNVAGGNARAIKDLDIGGIIVAIHHLVEDPKYIRKIKKEFVLGNFDQMIIGEDLKLLDT